MTAPPLPDLPGCDLAAPTFAATSGEAAPEGSPALPGATQTVKPRTSHSSPGGVRGDRLTADTSSNRPFAHPRSLDLAHEDAPNPAWLRQLAATLKLEAAVLEGHADTLAGLPVLRLPREWSPTRLAAQSLDRACRHLLRLADVLDETPVAS